MNLIIIFYIKLFNYIIKLSILKQKVYNYAKKNLFLCIFTKSTLNLKD
jgi:hypothetical protein